MDCRCSGRHAIELGRSDETVFGEEEKKPPQQGKMEATRRSQGKQASEEDEMSLKVEDEGEEPEGVGKSGRKQG